MRTGWGDLQLIDTPGFAEDGPAGDRGVVDRIAAAVDLSRLDAVLLVTRLDETRGRPDELRMIGLLTGEFGPAFWRKAWLVMTFAANVPAEARARRAQVRERSLADAVVASLDSSGEGRGFDGFRRRALVDNVVRGWSRKAVPLGQAFTAAT